MPMKRVVVASPERKAQMDEMIRCLNVYEIAYGQDQPDDVILPWYELTRSRGRKKTWDRPSEPGSYGVVACWPHPDGSVHREYGDLWLCTKCGEVREYFVGQVPGCWYCDEDDDSLA